MKLAPDLKFVFIQNSTVVAVCILHEFFYIMECAINML